MLQKGINCSQSTGKDELISKYYKIACPLPQRKYRSNRSGRKMAQSQIRVSKRKRTYDEIKESENTQGNRYTVIYNYVFQIFQILNI